MIIEFFIPLMGSFFSSGIFAFVFFPVLGLCLIATVPVILRYFIRG